MRKFESFYSVLLIMERQYMSKIIELQIEKNECLWINTLRKDFFKIIEKKYDERPEKYSKGSNLLAKYSNKLIKPGEVALLFSEPGSGSTNLLIKLMEEYLRQERPLLFSSPTLDRLDVISRIISKGTNIPINRLYSGNIYGDDWPNLVKMAGQLRKSEIYFSDGHWFDAFELEDMMTLWKDNEKQRGIFIFDDCCEIESMSLNNLEHLRQKIKKSIFDCHVPVIANVKVESVKDLYQNIRQYHHDGNLPFLLKSGTLIFYMKQPELAEVVFMSNDNKRQTTLRLEACADGTFHYA